MVGFHIKGIGPSDSNTRQLKTDGARNETCMKWNADSKPFSDGDLLCSTSEMTGRNFKNIPRKINSFGNIGVDEGIILQDRQCTYKSNIEARSRNYRCRTKA
jgi:hypothetical protein